MSIPFREFHLEQFFDSWDWEKVPLDLALYRFFKERRSLGSNDRKAITEAIYDYVKGTPFPEFLWDFLVRGYGEEGASNLEKIFNTRAPLTLRVNTLKTTRENLFKELEPTIKVALTKRSPWGIQVLEPAKVRELPAFKAGHFEIQDEGSQLIAELVTLNPGDRVLDYCAGSGGKSLAVAMAMKGRGQLYLHDIRTKSLYEARERLARAGVQNYQLLLSDSPQKKKLHGTMDWVLVDAPCSGTGTFRRSPELKWKITPESIDHLIQTQRQVFEEALPFLKQGGHIVYATCSLLPEENERQVDYFTANHSVKLVSTLKILPEENGPDGFYAALLDKY
jgi:16S rRNA (cytosine(967)-C(5))-methyltransferase